jgi:hypothetical protein
MTANSHSFLRIIKGGPKRSPSKRGSNLETYVKGQLNFLRFNRSSDFPEGGQGVGGILDRLLFRIRGITLEYRCMPLGAPGGRLSGDPG